ncbi:hypothetical protein Tco_0486907, partial [Tanacetum coccineum]
MSNAKTLELLTMALPEEQLLQITKHKTAKAIWDALKTRHIGEERVQQARLQTLKSDFEMLHMKEDEAIDTFTAKLNDVDTFQADKLMEIYKVTMFSMYCERKFEIEPVEVIYYDQKSHISPELCPYDMKVSLADINRTTGLSLEANEATCLYLKMLFAYEALTLNLSLSREEPKESVEFAGRKEMTVLPYCGYPA